MLQRKNLLFITVSFVFMGILISMEGMINKSLSIYFNRPIAEFVAIDANAIFIAVITNFLYQFLPRFFLAKQLFYLVYSLFIIIVFSILVSVYYKHLIAYMIFISAIGIPTGLIYPLLNQALFHISENAQRHFQITSLANAFWALGFFGGAIVINKLNYYLGILPVYLFIILISFIMIVFANLLISKGLRFEQPNIKTLTRRSSKPSFNWLLAIIACAFVCLTMTQSLYEYWIPNYIKSIHTIKPNYYGVIVGAFGLGQFVSRLFFGFYYNKLTLYKFIITCLILTVILAASLTLFQQTAILMLICFAIGLFTGPVLPAMIADAMSANKMGQTSSRTVAIIITAGTLGGIISLLSSSLILVNSCIAEILWLLPLTVLLAAILYYLRGVILKAKTII